MAATGGKHIPLPLSSALLDRSTHSKALRVPAIPPEAASEHTGHQDTRSRAAAAGGMPCTPARSAPAVAAPPPSPPQSEGCSQDAANRLVPPPAALGRGSARGLGAVWGAGGAPAPSPESPSRVLLRSRAAPSRAGHRLSSRRRRDRRLPPVGRSSRRDGDQRQPPLIPRFRQPPAARVPWRTALLGAAP